MEIAGRNISMASQFLVVILYIRFIYLINMYVNNIIPIMNITRLNIYTL